MKKGINMERERERKMNKQKKEMKMDQNVEGEGSLSLTLTNPTLFDCCKCFQPLSIPVFQCPEGHLVCSSCSAKNRDMCPSPSCYYSLSNNNCKAIENVLESAKISCQNIRYGCEAVLTYSAKREHEKQCIYVPIPCPLPNCSFIASSKNLSCHLSSHHSDSFTSFQYNCPFSVSMGNNDHCHVLEEEDEGSLFMVSRSAQLHVEDIKISCAGLRSSEERFIYDLSANSSGSSIRISSVMESIGSQVNNPSSKGFLPVPSGFLGSSGQLKLLLCIRPADRLFKT